MRKVIGSSPISSTKAGPSGSAFSFVKQQTACSGSSHRFESRIVHQSRTFGFGFFFCQAKNRLQWVSPQLRVPYRPPKPDLRVRLFLLSSGKPLAVGQPTGSRPVSSTKAGPSGSAFSFVKRQTACSGSAHSFESRIVHQSRTFGFGFFFFIYSRFEPEDQPSSGLFVLCPHQKPAPSPPRL